MNIIGNNISIKEFDYKYLDDFYEFSSNYDTAISAGWKPHPNIETSKRVMNGYIYSNTIYAIVKNDSNKLIGSIELVPSRIRENIAAYEIGFALNPKYVGFGYAKEACMLIMNYTFSVRKALVVEVCHRVGNIKSENTIKSLGFVREGIIRNYKRLFNQEIIDVVIYSMTLNEYERKYRYERIKNEI